VSDGWLTGKGTAIDIGCGLGIEADYLASVMTTGIRHFPEPDPCGPSLVALMYELLMA
jgi:hypothetical protein